MEISADPLDQDYIFYEIKKVQHHIFIQDSKAGQYIQDNLSSHIEQQLDFKSELFVKAVFKQIKVTIKVPKIQLHMRQHELQKSKTFK
jgi:hypothetical protein